MSNNCFGNYTTTGAAGPSVCNPAPVCCTPAEPPELETENESTETCACRDSLAAALQLLCSGDLPALIDFNRFAFLASSYLIGSYLVCPCGQTGTYDNLADTLTGSFNRFTPCSCELIDVSGQVYDAIPYYRPQTVANLFTVMSENLDGVEDAQGTINALAALAARIDPGSADFRPDLLEAFQPLLGACSCPNVSISEVSLCALDAIAFDAAGATPEVSASLPSVPAAKAEALRCPAELPEQWHSFLDGSLRHGAYRLAHGGQSPARRCKPARLHRQYARPQQRRRRPLLFHLLGEDRVYQLSFRIRRKKSAASILAALFSIWQAQPPAAARFAAPSPPAA